MVRTLLALGVGAALGALTTFFLRPTAKPTPPSTSLAPPCPTLVPSTAASTSADAEAAPRSIVRRAVFVPPPPPPAADATVPALRDENARLREQLEAVTHKLAVELKISAEEHGAPQVAPANLPPRFDGDALRRSMTDALREAGFQNAQVTSVDCTEYPCILYGEGMGRKEEFDNLEKTEAMQPFGDDAHSAMGWQTRGADGRPNEEFGLALYPKPADDAAGQQLRKRLQYRARLMREGD